MKIDTEKDNVKIEHLGGVFYFMHPTSPKEVMMYSKDALENKCEYVDDALEDLLIKVENVEINGKDVTVEEFKELVPKLPAVIKIAIYNKAMTKIFLIGRKEAEAEEKN